MLKNVFKSQIFVLSLILLMGLVFRLYKINNPLIDWHSWRQADTASVSRIYVKDGINLLFPRYYDISVVQSGLFNPKGYRFVEFPLYNAIHAVLYKTIPAFSLEMIGRLLSIFFSLISTVVIFLMGRRFIGKNGGLLASFFFAAMPYNVYFSRVILPEPMAIVLGLLGLWSFVLFADGGENKHLFASAVFFSLALLVKPFTLFYLFPLPFLIHKEQLKKIIIPALVIFVPFLVWRLWIKNFPEGIPFWKWAFNNDKIRFRPAFWKWIFGERIGRLFMGTWGMIPFGIGLLTPTKKSAFLYYFLISLMIFPFIFATASVRHDYYQTYLIPALCLILAKGSIYLWNAGVFNKELRRVLLIFSIAIMFLVGADLASGFYKYNYPQIVEAGERVDKITPLDAKVIAPFNGDTAFLYQTKRFGWPVKDEDIEDMVKKGADYYVSVDVKSKDTIEISEKYNVVETNDKFIIINLNDPK